MRRCRRVRVPQKRPSSRLTLAGYLSTLSSLQAWWDPTIDDYFTFSTGAQVSAWLSRAGALGAISWGQATSANQATRALAVANMGNKNTVRFDGTNDFFTISNQNAVKFLHDGTGATVIWVRRIDSTGPATQQILLSAALNTEIGVGLSYTTTPATSLRWRNGSGTLLAALDPAGSGVRDASAWEAVSYADELITHARSGSVTTAADTVGQEPSASNPTRALILGSTAVATTNPLKGDLGDVLMFSEVLSETVRNNVVALLAQKYGVAA